MNLAAWKPNNRNILVSRYQTTAQIAGSIIRAIKESMPAAMTLKPYFTGYPKKTQARLIFTFIKKAVPYKKEAADRQTAKTLPRIISDARFNGGDCKHYATASAAICKTLNIPCKLRLISQTLGSKTPNHIYTVAIINGQEVIIDPVLKQFGTEANYFYKYDIEC